MPPTPSPPCVVLLGLSAMYGHGLQDALTAAGVGPVVLAERGDLPRVLPGDRPTVVVVSPGEVEPLGVQLQRAADQTRVAVVQLVEDTSTAGFVTAVCSGASGVLQVTAELDTAVEVVRSAAEGRIVLPERVARALSEPGFVAGAPHLEPQELQWLRLLGQGTTIAALARAAVYSEREMYRLLSRVYERLGATNRTEALLRAERWGLLDDR